MSRSLVHQHLEKWRSELIDLTRRNRLLYFKHTKSASMEFEQPSATVLEGLGGRGANAGWRFWLPEPPEEEEPEPDPAEAGDDELIVKDKYRPDIERGLKRLESVTSKEYLDSGLWILYLGVGMLRWIDPGEAPGRQEAWAPLMLVPVKLDRSGGAGSYRLTESDEDRTLNPALAVKLERDFGVRLPSLDDIEDATPESVLNAIREAVRDKPGWVVEDRVVLTTFSFHKEVIYRDLLVNADQVAEHPLIQLLAEGPSSATATDLDFAPVPEDDLDSRHPPEELACVLNADATQRQCLLAAQAGHSFVMDGPPGTGKSQTITNMIAQLMHDGKTVLFVSEKAAALEVVHRNLERLSLAPFVLELHSHKANRREVAEQLARALTERPRARSSFSETDRSRLIANREKLTSFAVAMNEVRSPLGRSLHDVIGRVSALEGLADAPMVEASMLELDPAEFSRIIEAAERLARAWGPVDRGSEFLWRDLANVEMSAAHRADIERRVVDGRAALRDLQTAARAVSDTLRLGGLTTFDEVRTAIELARLIEHRPPIGPEWLTDPEIDSVDQSVDELRALLANQASVQNELESAVGPTWRHAAVEDANRVLAAQGRLSDFEPIALGGHWSPSDLRTLSGILIQCADSLASIDGAELRLAERFGVHEPSLELLSRVAELASMAGVADRPEARWLDPLSRAALQQARAVLTECLTTFRERRESLATVFTDGALALDLQALHTRFTTVHTGLRRLSSAYRDDKRALAAVTVSGRVDRVVLDRLEEAVAWQRLEQRLAEAERVHGELLGTYYQHRDTADPDRIAEAVALADRALELAGREVPHTAVANQISKGASPSPEILSDAEAVASALDYLRSSVQPWLGAQALDFVLELRRTDAHRWLCDLAGLVDGLARTADDLGAAVDRSLTVETAGSLASLLNREAEVTGTIGRLLPPIQEHLGSLARDLDPTQLETAQRWVASVRAANSGPLRESTARAVLGTGGLPVDLDGALRTYVERVDRLLALFEQPQQAELRNELFDDLGEAGDLLEGLEHTLDDLVEWASHVSAREDLEQAGVGSVVAALLEARAARELVVPTIERCVLTRWVDEIEDSDDRLRPSRAQDRDALAEEFKRLDRALIESTAAKVVNACSSRRPQSKVGQAGIILQQANLKRRHKPVRRLLSDAGEVAQQLKPCFMMSPLSVSQLLPPNLQFDVVIFDEASQVREADAVGCVYRGRQLIVAGDPRQLPPTTFFDQVADGSEAADLDEEDAIHDFESVLDRCKAQGLPALPLSWHYRSRHESLITYSNYSFYEGRLHTFPSATFESPDLGVEMFRVDGKYRRGSTQDNPTEAETIIDRVVFHRIHHPELTIGAVALSAAQQDAIEAALERRAEVEPLLRELVTDDRLDGFFVKNLENVQGDERDIILLSIGYGPDEFGKFSMNFGPLNREGGERRLNVAITRARRRVEVVCSFSPGELRSENPRLVHLRRYLEFAERGIAALSLEVEESLGDAESPFEAEVASTIRRLGYEAVPQVGVAGYRIDIGVRHPTKPGTYVLGVECDGAAYHSSKVARDRDRLRQEVLEGLEWSIHRIWSTAWFHTRASEEARLKEAIEQAIKGGRHVSLSSRNEPADPIVEVDVEAIDMDAMPQWVSRYEPPQLTRPRTNLEMHEPEARGLLIELVRSIVEQSGPIHQELALRYARETWGVGRAGSRVKAAFRQAVRSLVTTADLVEVGDVLFFKGTENERVRVPFEDDEPRRVEYVPPSERELALVKLVRDAGAVSKDDLCKAWARLFGWRRVGPDIEVAYEDALTALTRSGVLRLDAGTVTAEGEDQG